MSNKNVSGQIVDVVNQEIFPGVVHFERGRILKIEKNIQADSNQYILPGFIDAHVHIESSMLVPSEFARLAVVHGTVATVSDPHEIGNVLGIEGVRYMIENGSRVNFKFFFGAPSCVPATPFETASATISAEEIEELFLKDNVKYLSEMMNWPGVLNGDPDVYKKIAIAKQHKREVDGHSPGLKGEKAKKYIEAGITTDHECFTREEAADKLIFGMKVVIREGSAAKNFEALIDLLHDHYENMMFCSDDKHPDNLVESHINDLVRRAVKKGISLFKVLKAACINPVDHYGLEVGTLKEGDPADFIVVDNLTEFKVKQTFINGELVAEDGKTKLKSVDARIVNNFHVNEKQPPDFQLKCESDTVHVIEALDGQLVTNLLTKKIDCDGSIQSDLSQDILKITVVNRYKNEKPAIAFIKNFGLKSGAIASSVAHDSHNIISVGVDDESITEAVNLIINARGGVSAVYGDKQMIVPLPVAGLMSNENGYQVAEAYRRIDKMAKVMGSKLTSPFMTLSFMALLVIPSLKLSDKGLFDGNQFKFKSLFA